MSLIQNLKIHSSQALDIIKCKNNEIRAADSVRLHCPAYIRWTPPCIKAVTPPQKWMPLSWFHNSKSPPYIRKHIHEIECYVVIVYPLLHCFFWHCSSLFPCIFFSSWWCILTSSIFFSDCTPQ